jgi:transglycosylase-like protein with SLT domain
MPISDYDDVFDAAAKEWNVDPDLLRAVARQESNGDPNARSKAGAIGLMQIMPETAKGLGVANPRDAVQSIYGGAKYLSQLLDKYKNPETALAAYNAGPGRVDDAMAGRGALPAETRAYVPAIAGHYKALTDAAAKLAPAPAPAPATAATPAPAKSGGMADMSDADFLKTTAVSPSADDDNAFLARTGGKASAPAPVAGTPATPSTADSSGFITSPGKPAVPAVAPVGIADVDSEGNPIVTAPDGKVTLVPQGPTTGQIIAKDANAIGGVIGDTARGVAEGYGTQPVVTVPTEALQNAGVFNKPGQNGLLRSANEALINGAAGAADVALRGGNALLRGYQAGVSSAGEAAGAPLLGRDLAALPEAFQGSPGMLHPGVPPEAAPIAAANELSPAIDRPYLSPAFQDAPVAPAAQAAIEQARTMPANPLMPVRPESVPASDGLIPAGPTSAVPGAEQPVAGRGVAAPNSVGAAASSANETGITRKQELAYRSTAEGQKLLEPQQPGIEDRAQYVQNSNPNSAEIEQSVNTSRELKSLGMTAPDVSQEMKDVAARNNDARSEHFQQTAGSDVDIANATAARGAQAEKDLAETWARKTPADAQPVIDAANDILSGPDSKRTLVRNAVNDVTGQLFDKDGKLETDPEMLYGVRKHIDDLMSKEAGATDPKSVRAMSNLQALKSSLDDVIENAAPGFKQYLQNFADASKRIDEMSVLQKFEPKLYDAQNRMTYSKVQTMMRQIVDSRQAPGINAAKSITDDTMARLWALRDDLRRSASAQELARAPGSDTVQNALDVAKSIAGRAALHGAATAIAGPGTGSMLLRGIGSVVSPVLEQRRLQKMTERGMNLLHPKTPLHNPLAGP